MNISVNILETILTNAINVTESCLISMTVVVSFV